MFSPDLASRLWLLFFFCFLSVMNAFGKYPALVLREVWTATPPARKMVSPFYRRPYPEAFMTERK
jgi:hypothetical protein